MFHGIDGFLGSRAPLMVDVVSVAMFVILPVLYWSIRQVRVHRRYTLHKRVQIGLGLVLLVAVGLFEWDMRVNGWRTRAAESPFADTWVPRSLMVHLAFAVTTALLWIFVTVAALRKFARPPAPNEHSRQHIYWARMAAFDMTMTAVTGWLFYYLAFVAAK